MTTIRPFDAGGWFPIHNHVFDVIMPSLSPNGWKILCVAIRQTWGWRATGDPTGMTRREWDRISYSQFQEKSGIGSRATVRKALLECLDAGYLLRHQDGMERGKPRYFYSLNRDYEVEVPTSTETEPVVTGTEIEPVTGTEIEPVTGTETVLTKQRKQTNKAGGDGEHLSEQQTVTFNTLAGLGLTTARKWANELEPAFALEWVEYVRRNRGSITDPAAFLESRFQIGESAPVTSTDVSQEDRRRFIEGKFADIVQH